VPYFFILPAFLIFEIVLLLAALVARYREKFCWASGYLVGIALGSAAGFVLANLILWFVCAALAFLANKDFMPEIVRTITQYISAFGLLIGPFVVSGGGLLIGTLFGTYFVYRRRKKKNP
jgi:hypothetical protein